MQTAAKKLRHELKFFINQHQYLELSRRLRVVMRPDRFALVNGEYQVRSLYFDDAADSALYDKSYGVFRRDKYRIRIYNQSDQRIRLERKSKFGQYIQKEAELLTREEYEAIMRNDFSFLTPQSGPLLREFQLVNLNKVLRPKVIVDYDREAYIYNASEVRVTFDKLVRAGVNSDHLFDPGLVTINALAAGLLVMEVKYNEFLPDSVRMLLQTDSHERSAISKYVICRLIKNNI